MDNEDNAILAEKLFTAIKTERKSDVEKYLCLGADPNYLLLNHITPFHLASGCSQSYEFVHMILEHGNGNPNVRNTDGLTPLHVATLWGKTDCVQLMVDNFGDIFARDNEGKDLKWYAKESGSEKCISLVDDLMRRNNCRTRTPKTTKHGHFSSDKKVKRNKENRTPKSSAKNYINSPQGEAVSIRSPLHSQCNDSWVAKHRGSARRRFGSISRENSPSTSPLFTRAMAINNGKCSPNRKEHCLVQPIDVMNTISGRSSPLSYSPTCANDLMKQKQPCIHGSPYKNMENHAVESICSSCAVNQLQSASCNTSMELCKKCGNLDGKSETKEVLNTTDKCIGTSILEPYDGLSGDVETDSVGCQVTFIQGELPRNDLKKSTSCFEVSDLKTEVKDSETNTERKVRSAESSVNYISAMDEFLKSCVEGGKKGLDVSSPDHCLSYDLSENSSTGNKTPDNIDENIIYTPKSCRRDKNLVKSPENSPSRRNLLLSTKVPLSDELMLKYYGQEFLQSFDEKHDSTTKTSMNDEIKIIDSDNVVKNIEDKVTTDLNFTFSDSTVPVIQDDSVFESSSTSICEEKSSQSSVLLRKFAAPNSQSSEVKEKFLFSSVNNVSSVTTNGRLHSTALHETQNFEIIDEESFDISVIRATDSSIDDRKERDSDKKSSKGNESSLHSQLSTTTDSNDASSQSTIVYNWKSFWRGESIPESALKKTTPKKKSSSSTPEIDENLEKISNEEIRNQLISFGFNPGPIAASRVTYLNKLKSLINKSKMQDDRPKSISEGESMSPTSTINEPKFSSELHGIIMGRAIPSSVVDDDTSVRQQFENPDPDLQWREGTMKNSFTYLLLDPRVTDKLPIRAKSIPEQESFKSFVGSIFYVGKGKQSRPYSHFHEALQTNRMLYKLNPSQKIRHIHDIWNAGLGVISLHVSQSVIACEAYTREASMIEAIGLEHLTNRKRGDFYGVATSWNGHRKKLYGSFLVKKAMEVLMVEGERQIRPTNLKSHNTRQWTGCNGPIASS